MTCHDWNFAGSAATAYDYAYAGVGPLGLRLVNGAASFTHADALGSPLAATDGAGAVSWRESYAPFGKLRLNPLANQNNTGFTGHLEDSASGLVYMQARYYDPLIGRFYSTDPVGYQDQINLYAYVHNDPVNLTDPTGAEGAGWWNNGLGHPPTAADEARMNQQLDAAGKGLRSFTLDSLPVIGEYRAVTGFLDHPSLVTAVIGGASFVDLGPEAKALLKWFSAEKQALVDMAKADKRVGITAEDMQAYKDLNKELPDPFPDRAVRGPEEHPTAKSPSSRASHGHVGPVDHIPIKPAEKQEVKFSTCTATRIEGAKDC